METVTITQTVATPGYLRIHTSKAAALTLASATDCLVHIKRNKTSANPVAYERALLIPQSSIDNGLSVLADLDVSRATLDVIRAARTQAAEYLLRQHCESTSYASEMPAKWFETENLDATFVRMAEGDSSWLSKEELEKLWNASATRKRFVSSPQYTTNRTVQKAIAMFERVVLSLAGKATMLDEDWQNRLLAKMDENDLDSPLGKFITFRIEKMRQRADEIEDDALDALDALDM